VSLSTNSLGASSSQKKVRSPFALVSNKNFDTFTEDESEESESEEEEEDEEPAAAAPTDGLQTPSGLATPSGMASVVSTVAGGLETPDFLELRKNASRPTPSSDEGPRSLYQVVPERQTSVRGLMGSERGYDVSSVAGGAAIPVLGEERGTKVIYTGTLYGVYLTERTIFFLAQGKRRRSFY
jgi:hypothetical protein